MYSKNFKKTTLMKLNLIKSNNILNCYGFNKGKLIRTVSLKMVNFNLLLQMNVREEIQKFSKLKANP